MIDDSGQMSIDFLIGFTIFIIGIIIVVTLMSGLLVGLQSKTIDLDAVAYRTGVILVEDPGQLNPENPYGYADEWELIDLAYKDDILRLGMALSKDYPNILTRAKVEGFFDSSFFSYPDDYRRTLFFTGEGMYEYHFNIMLTDLNSYLSIGESVPTNQQYGYIKRAVFIKEPPNGAEFICTGDPERVDINFDFSTLHDGDRGPIFWIDPLKEKIIIRLITDAGVELDNVYLSHVDENGIISPIPGQYNLPVTTSGDPAPPYRVNIPDDGSGAGYVEIEFPQGYFEPFSASKFQLSFDFDPDATGSPQLYDYDYSVPSLSSPLTPATLEVCVW